MRSLVALLTLAFAVPAIAVEKKPVGPNFSGSLKSIESDKIMIVLPSTDKKVKPENKILTLDKNVKVFVQDVLDKNAKLPEGKLSDLTPGTLISLQLDADSKVVQTITARGATLRGGVKSVDAKKRTMVITLKEDKGKTEKTITLGDKAKILMNDGLTKESKDKEGKLEELTEGMSVSVQMSVDQKTALQIRPSARSVQGTLKGIDSIAKRILVTVKGENGEEDLTFFYDEGAKVDTNLTGGITVSLRISVFDKEKALELIEIKK